MNLINFRHASKPSRSGAPLNMVSVSPETASDMKPQMAPLRLVRCNQDSWGSAYCSNWSVSGARSGTRSTYRRVSRVADTWVIKNRVVLLFHLSPPLTPSNVYSDALVGSNILGASMLPSSPICNGSVGVASVACCCCCCWYGCCCCCCCW